MATTVVVQPVPVSVGEPVNTNLPLSIVSCICCNFCCLGLVALICSLQANNAQQAGHTEEAKDKAALAKKLAIAAIIGTIIVVVISVIAKLAGA